MEKPIKVAFFIDHTFRFGGGEIFMNELSWSFDPKLIEFTCFTAVTGCEDSYFSTHPLPCPFVPIEESKPYLDQVDCLLYSGAIPDVHFPKVENIRSRILVCQSDFHAYGYLIPNEGKATHYIAVSQRVRDQVAKENCPIIYQGINRDAYTASLPRKILRSTLDIDPTVFLVGMFCRLEDYKGVSTTIHALSQLPHHYHLLLIGDGPYRTTLLDQCRDLLPNRYHFLSSIHCYRLGSFYNILDAFVIASHGEGCPRTFWEAIHFGVPFLGTPVGSIPEFVHSGKNGFVFQGAHQLSHQLRQLGRTPKFRDQFFVENRELLEKFGHIKQTARRFETVIQEVVS